MQRKILKLKELSFCHKLRFSNSYNLATRFPRPLIFQTITSGRSNSLSLKYQRFTALGCKDIGVRKCKFVAKTQFLWYLKEGPKTPGRLVTFNPKTGSKFLTKLLFLQRLLFDWGLKIGEKMHQKINIFNFELFYITIGKFV